MSTHRTITSALLASELNFSTSRSGGPGGQNVNKVNSKVTLRFDVGTSMVLTIEEKEIILQKLASWITKDGALAITSQEKRSQLENKQQVMEKFDQLMIKAFTKKKKRKATRPSKGSVEKRIAGKKSKSEKKKWRQNPDGY